MSAPLEDDELAIELDGTAEVADPLEIEPTSALRLAVAFFDLVREMAEQEESEIQLKGLEVRDKCTAIVTHGEPADVVKRLMTEAAKLVAEGARPPRGMRVKVQALREAIDTLPKGVHVAAYAGRLKRRLRAAPAPAGFASETIVVRGVPLRIGGRDPLVRVDSASEPRPMVLALTRELAKDLAHYLYIEVEIEAQVERAGDGTIESGTLLAFHPLDDGNALQDWKDFLTAGGARDPEDDDSEPLNEERPGDAP